MIDTNKKVKFVGDGQQIEYWHFDDQQTLPPVVSKSKSDNFLVSSPNLPSKSDYFLQCR